MHEPVILSAVRTPLGKFQGSLSTIRAPDLGGIAIREAVKRSGLEPKDVTEVIMGNVLPAGLGQNVARQAAIAGGIPYEAGALHVNKVCGSGLKAVVLAAQAIMLGDEDVVVAGGMENMSQAPHALMESRTGIKLFDGKLRDTMVYDGLWDYYNDFHMGMTGEIIAEKFNISRAEMDDYAFNSHKKAVKAIEEGKFKDEVVPVPVPQKKGDPIMFEKDEGPRADTTVETLARLKPFFKKDGKVTAGNASTINDGASALVVTSRERADKIGAKPLAIIKGYATGGMEPAHVMSAPIPTVRKVLTKMDLKIKDFGLFEVNEAFSSQAVAVTRELGMDQTKVNVHGGAVALGHPIGCSGARILTTLLYAMQQRRVKRGMATLCMGGGLGVAMVVEREQ